MNEPTLDRSQRFVVVRQGVEIDLHQTGPIASYLGANFVVGSFIARRALRVPGWQVAGACAMAGSGLKLASVKQPTQARTTLTAVAVRFGPWAFAGFLLWYLLREIPLEEALAAAAPAVLLVGTLPITPAGLGTQQAAVVYFYRAYAPEAELLAFGLLLPFVFILMRVPLSFFYLHDLAALRAEIATERDEDT